jgi:hypothetical protein
MRSPSPLTPRPHTVRCLYVPLHTPFTLCFIDDDDFDAIDNDSLYTVPKTPRQGIRNTTHGILSIIRIY